MGFNSRLGQTLAVVTVASVLGSGCASTNNKGGGEASVYRESATDIANRAPSSMSLPSEENGVPMIDQVHIRTKADYHFTLAEAFSLEGDSPRAIEEYKLTLVYDPSSAQVRLRLAAEYVKQGLVSEAIEQCKSALESEPKHQDARLLLGGLYSALRMYDDALKEYRQVMTDDPTNYEAPLFVGALLAEQKKYAEAAVVFEKIAKEPSNPQPHLAWYYLGRVRLEGAPVKAGAPKNDPQQVAKAEAAFKESMAAKPSYTEAVLALGMLYEGSGKKAQAKQLYQTYQEKSGPSSAVAEELSRLYIDEKDYTRAFEQLAVMEASDRSDLNVKAKMAFILIEQSRYQEAIVRLEEVLAIEPASDKIRFYLGAVYEEVKDYGAAISHFAKIPMGSSYYKEAVIHASYLHKLLGDYDKAIASIQGGIKNIDDHPPFYALYASLLDDTKQFKRAAEMLTGAVAKFPEHAQLHYFLGSMQDRLGQKDATVASMRKVLTLDKDHVQALNFLAYTYAESGSNLDQAEEMVRRALEIQPNDGYILDTLGWVQFKRGRVTDAVRTLEAAYKIQPDESIIAEHLADAYYHQQMPEKAKKLYLRAAELESNGKQLEKIRAKIVSVDRQIQTLGGGDRKPASAEAK